jgi:thioredoxin-related protein
MSPLKTIILAIFSVAFPATAQAGDFLTDFDAGKKKAAAEKKCMLVKFTGSDWCLPCKNLDKQVFSKKAFKSEVEKEFVVVVLDYPRTKKLPAAQAKANKEVAKKYNVQGWPTVMLMDSQGKVFKLMPEYPGDGVEPYLKALKNSLKARKFH